MVSADTYNNLYSHSNYNDPALTDNDTKWLVIKTLLPSTFNTAVDLGCGRGFYLKKLLELGKSSIGVEFSESCCKKYLSRLPHVCESVTSFCNTKKEYDLAICIDVLEHIPEDQIDETLKSIKAISKCAIFGIANHSDILDGIEVHLIQENKDWWVSKISEHYRQIISADVSHIYGDRFFIFKCINNT
jgi:2-polyprenyl-3-methyl-5-hydroxy-6-metoxy-1,4-benzoquinol methylase